MSGQRKIALFITEGGSDVTALSLPLEKLLKDKGLSSKVQCKVYGTDPLLHRLQDKDNPSFEPAEQVTERIKEAVSDFLSNEDGGVFTASDIACVAVLCDLDACFCKDECIQHRQNEHISYDVRNEAIYCQNIPYVKERNDTKRDAFGILVSDQIIQITNGAKGIPLGVFYMNLNLEHALYGETGITDPDVKNDKAAAFRSLYRENSIGFEALLKSLQLVGSTYVDSHDEATLRKLAFDRISNLFSVVDWITKIVKL